MQHPFGEAVTLPCGSVNSGGFEFMPVISHDWPRAGSSLYFGEGPDIWESVYTRCPPPATVERTILTGPDLPGSCGGFQGGVAITVELRVTALREGGQGGCESSPRFYVKETIPEGWVPAELAGGVLDESRSPITSGIDFCLAPDSCAGLPPARFFIRGDADSDGSSNITDAIRILNFLFLAGAAPPCAEAADTDAIDITDAIRLLGYLFLGDAEPPCRDAADADDSDVVNITDAVRVLNYLFLGGPPPRAPGPLECGEDPSKDEIGCNTAGPGC